MTTGIRVLNQIGIGDAIQFSSIPENFYRHFGEMVVDEEKSWVFDHNPFVLRDCPKPEKTIELWTANNFDVPNDFNGRNVAFSNAEIHSRHFGYDLILNRPRLYYREDFEYSLRKKIVLHLKGRSHGQLPEHIVRHVIAKYQHCDLWIMALPGEWTYSFPIPESVGEYTPSGDLWSTVDFISTAKMFIGPDSGPSWIAQCYPDIVVKKVRLFPSVKALNDWVPLEWCRIGSYWDDRSAFIYNPSEDDVGFTWSYRRI